MTYCPLESTFDSSGENVYRRDLYGLDVFEEREPPESVLRTVLSYWNTLAADGTTPLSDDFLSGKVTPILIQGNVTVIDVSDPNPMNFTIRSTASSKIVGLGTNFENTLVNDFPCNMSARALMADYFRVRELRQPLYHEIEEVLFGHAQHYARLILPLTNEKDYVSTLVVAGRPLMPPQDIASDE
ncbi:MAG: hypothetical protein QF654_11480 [Alphaproteobacteria bacterium]|jgi:hypothetical protein|nr:hypothetical protein [Alphaproteobacteria bacterium]